MMATKQRKRIPEFLADQLVRHRFLLLPLALLLLACSWPLAKRLKFDQSIESLYAGDDPHLADYKQSKRLFGGDEFAIVAYTDPELLNQNPMTPWISKAAATRVQELAQRLSAVEGVRATSTQDLASLTERTRMVVGEKGRAIAFLMMPSAMKTVYRQVEGVLIGEDGRTTAVVLRLTPEDQLTAPQTRGKTIAEIRRVAGEFGTLHHVQVAVVGEPVQVHDMFRYVEEDGRTLFYWSLVALSIVILGLFRSLRWVVIPALIVVATIVWTDALLVQSGMKLSMVSSMMNSLVTIIGIATVTHITVHYREERRHHERIVALRRTLSDLLPAVLWTCATTAVGFAALLSSRITPVRSFGLMVASATLIVLVATAAILPGGTLLGRLDADPRWTPAEDALSALLSRTATGVRRHPVGVCVIMLGLFVFAALGLTRLRVETDFSRNFRESSPIVQSLSFVETKLAGAGSWEVNFPAPSTLDEDYLEDVRRLAQKLREIRVGDARLTKVIAMTDGIDALPPVLYPTLKERLQTVGRLQPEFVSSLYNPRAGRMRIVLRAPERRQSAEKLKLIARVEAVADEWARHELHGKFEHRDADTTGLYVLLAFLIENLLQDQLVSFALAAAGIVVMMAVAFRSVSIGLLLLLPNTFPIVLVIGGIGWLGIPINIATAMIASVSMGLTVDFSIHYLAGYFRGRRRGLAPEEALSTTLRSVGRALVFANLALIVGFSVLSVSHFIPLVYFGILVSFTMIGGLISDLVLLPLILRFVDRTAPGQMDEAARQEHPPEHGTRRQEVPARDPSGE